MPKTVASAAGLEPYGQNLCKGRKDGPFIPAPRFWCGCRPGKVDRFEISSLDHIHAGQAEMACRSEQPNVIRMDLFEPVFGRTGQVEGIGGAQ